MGGLALRIEGFKETVGAQGGGRPCRIKGFKAMGQEEKRRIDERRIAWLGTCLILIYIRKH